MDLAKLKKTNKALLEELGLKSEEELRQLIAKLGQAPVTLTVAWHPAHGMSIGVLGRPSPRLAVEILMEAVRKFTELDVASKEASSTLTKPAEAAS